jgi:hypothetical protein
VWRRKRTFGNGAHRLGADEPTASSVQSVAWRQVSSISQKDSRSVLTHVYAPAPLCAARYAKTARRTSYQPKPMVRLTDAGQFPMQCGGRFSVQFNTLDLSNGASRTNVLQSSAGEGTTLGSGPTSSWSSD